MNSLVSIIMPCYNSEKYLDMSIGSIYDQDYDNIELIIINDGSTDGSEDKILEWKDKFITRGYSLQYINQTNQGQGAAVSNGLKYITGKYLTLLDSDDYLYPNSVSLRVAFLDKNDDYSGVRSNGYYVKNGQRRVFITDENEKNITDLFTALTLGKTNNWAGTYMLRTEVLFATYPDRNIFPSRLGQNFQLLLPVSYKRKFGYIDEPLMDYYLYDDSHSHIGNSVEKYEIAKKNYAGWREIYYKTLDVTTDNSEEKELYHNMYDSVFYRRELNLALEYDKRKDAIYNYKQLKKTHMHTIDDAITLYSSICVPVAIALRAVRKIKNIISDGNN